MPRWMPHAITVVGYFLSGVAGLQLGMLQGYASPLFPAAGWALAALLLYGARAAGSMGGRLPDEPGCRGRQRAVWTASSGAIAALIAIGACVQAWLGSVLIRRRLGEAWQRLEQDAEILQFTSCSADRSPVSFRRRSGCRRWWHSASFRCRIFRSRGGTGGWAIRWAC